MVARRICTVVVVVVSAVSGAAMQEPARTFEVVSIKRSSPDATGGRVGTRPGRFSMVNMDVGPLIGTAYRDDVDTSEYVGLPEWAWRDRYDVEAAMPEGAKPADIGPMMRALLAERFAFRAHVETREGSIYELVRVNPNGPLPAGVEKIDIDCGALRAARARGEKPEVKPLTNGLVPCDYSMSSGAATEILTGGTTMPDFGASIQSGTGRIVRDRTGLEGYYSFRFRYTGRPSPDSDVPSLFTALQEQLGLRLESARGPVRMLVIDHMERPTEN